MSGFSVASLGFVATTGKQSKKDEFACGRKNALLFAAILVGCSHQASAQQQHSHSAVMAQSVTAPQPRQAQVPAPSQAPSSPPAATMVHGDMHAPTVFTLRSGIAQGRMVYIGVAGDIDGKVNPVLMAHEAETVQINLINGEGAEHDIVVDQYAARSDRIVGPGASSTVAFTADKAGEFVYFCSVPGHREAGMEGRIQVSPTARAAVASIAPEIVRDPTDLPPPIRARPPQIVRVDLQTTELKRA
jgi:nitrite reductase (NO-forming)